MTLNRALQILAKFFAVGEDVFSHQLSKTTIISWAEQIKAGEVKDFDGKVIPPGNYRLTQEQHSFLTGEIFSF
jgi:hypothetical protein